MPNFTEKRENDKRVALAAWNDNVKRAHLQRQLKRAITDADKALDSLSNAHEALHEAQQVRVDAERLETSIRSKLAGLSR